MNNNTTVQPKLTISKAVKPKDLAELKQAGYSVIINCRPDSEDFFQPLSADFESESKQLGLTYIHIPFAMYEVNDRQESLSKELLSAVNNHTNESIFIFCRSGGRVQYLLQTIDPTHFKHWTIK